MKTKDLRCRAPFHKSRLDRGASYLWKLAKKIIAEQKQSDEEIVEKLLPEEKKTAVKKAEIVKKEPCDDDSTDVDSTDDQSTDDDATDGSDADNGSYQNTAFLDRQRVRAFLEAHVSKNKLIIYSYFIYFFFIADNLTLLSSCVVKTNTSKIGFRGVWAFFKRHRIPNSLRTLEITWLVLIPIFYAVVFPLSLLFRRKKRKFSLFCRVRFTKKKRETSVLSAMRWRTKPTRKVMIFRYPRCQVGRSGPVPGSAGFLWRNRTRIKSQDNAKQSKR